MATVANVKKEDGSHWYYPDGKPCYELPKKDGGMKSPTLADARKLNLFPGVSTILKVLHKENLVNWLIEQAVLAILTTPRITVVVAGVDGNVTSRPETDDEFTKRVLSTERVQDQESQVARDRGTQMHDGLDLLCKGQPVASDLLPWIKPAFDSVMKHGTVLGTEISIVGRGYGGRIDLIQKAPVTGSSIIWIWDWKTGKKLPEKGAWSEHKLQLAAYAMAVQEDIFRKTGETVNIFTGNAYISTIEQGSFVLFPHEESPENNWRKTFNNGFAPLVSHWQWSNNYYPVKV